MKTRAIVNLKQEISARDEMIKSCQEKLLKHSNSQVCNALADLIVDWLADCWLDF